MPANEDCHSSKGAMPNLSALKADPRLPAHKRRRTCRMSVREKENPYEAQQKAQ